MKHTAASADAPTPLRRRLVLAGALLPALRPVRAAARTLVLGQVTSLSGNNGADLGQGLKAGIEACLQASNAAGGVRGQMLRLVSKDDGYAPEETVRQTRALIEEVQPVALIGYRGTANTLAVIESRVLAQSGITLVGSLTGAREVQGAPGLINLRTSYEREVSQLVAQIRRMSLDTLSVLYVDDAFGRTGLAAVELAAAAHGAPLLAAVAYDKAPERVVASVADAARRLAANPAKALVIVAVGEPVYAFIKAFRPLSPSTVVFCMSVVDAGAVVKRCGTVLAAGVGFSQVFPFPYSAKMLLVREYRQALARLSDSPAPNYFSLEGYVYARVLIEALKRAPDAPSSARLGAVLDALPPLDIGGLQVRIDPRSRNGLGYTDLTVLTREGKLVG